MKAVSTKQIQHLDNVAINQYGVPSLALMENAGRAVAMGVLKSTQRIKSPVVTIVCGLGNNAGDGFVAARHLLNNGIQTNIILVGKGDTLKQDALINYQILKRLKYPIKEVKRITASIVSRIQEADIVVDAIFGVGLNRTIADPFQTMIEIMTKESKQIIAVDIPSGLDGTTGKIYGVCIKAKETISFSFPKKGFFINEGPHYTGKVQVVDIGIPEKLMSKIIK